MNLNAELFTFENSIMQLKRIEETYFPALIGNRCLLDTENE